MYFSDIILGSFHQGSDMFFGSAGKQCICNAIVALAYSCLRHPSEWLSCDMDTFLMQGDYLYNVIPMQEPTGYLFIEDIPTTFQAFNYMYNIQIIESYTGMRYVSEIFPPYVTLEHCIT